MSELQESQAKTPITVRILGWLLGSLSVLNLVTDTTPIELYGSLREWSDAYGAFVATIGRAAFGWIHWRWIEVDSTENHVILIGFLMAGALGRANSTTERARGKTVESVGLLIAFAIAMGLVFCCLMLLLPYPYGVGVGLFVETFVISYWAIKGEDDFVKAKEFRKELVVVLAGFMIIILMNYAIFRPS